DINKFPLVNLIKILPKNNSLFETILITVNDFLVYRFLEKKISFQKLINLIHKLSNLREFRKFKKIKPKTVEDIYRLRDYVSFKMKSFSI
ncbi:1-deoxy-D-xylulose-5-phosphate reductoisomerase, partial [Pelagibacterales bacterium SAG-MED01]|nr:1-deoxy-D-xylulose-5-phosphate reductoisomerase [Pelagibacterales bacterium SAG-MED01]